jgi:hypothetical protein
LTILEHKHSVDYTMKLGKHQAKLGEDFLVLRKMKFYDL